MFYNFSLDDGEWRFFVEPGQRTYLDYEGACNLLCQIQQAGDGTKLRTILAEAEPSVNMSRKSNKEVSEQLAHKISSGSINVALEKPKPKRVFWRPRIAQKQTTAISDSPGPEGPETKNVVINSVENQRRFAANTNNDNSRVGRKLTFKKRASELFDRNDADSIYRHMKKVGVFPPGFHWTSKQKLAWEKAKARHTLFQKYIKNEPLLNRDIYEGMKSGAFFHAPEGNLFSDPIFENNRTPRGEIAFNQAKGRFDFFNEYKERFRKEIAITKQEVVDGLLQGIFFYADGNINTDPILKHTDKEVIDEAWSILHSKDTVEGEKDEKEAYAIVLRIKTSIAFPEHSISKGELEYNIDIGAKLDVGKGDEPLPVTGRFSFDSTDGDFEMIHMLSKADFENLRESRLHIWGAKPGEIALKGPQHNFAYGVAVIELQKMPANDAGLFKRIVVDIEAVEGVVKYIVSEMNRNRNSYYRFLMEVANEGWANEPEGLEEWAELTAIPIVQLMAFEKFENDWNYKPVISKVWGDYNRIGNFSYFHPNDLWSNVHFGYIAYFGGYKRDFIHNGADLAQAISKSKDTFLSKGFLKTPYVFFTTRNPPGDIVQEDIGFDLAVMNKESDLNIQQVLEHIENRRDMLEHNGGGFFKG